MSTIKKLVTSVLILSFIITPIVHADQKKENFWDKPAHKALVITGAAACAVVVAMVVYGYTKKDVPLVAGNTALPSAESTVKKRLSFSEDVDAVQLQVRLAKIDEESEDESDGEGEGIRETRRLLQNQQEGVDRLSASLDQEEVDDFELED